MIRNIVPSQSISGNMQGLMRAQNPQIYTKGGRGGIPAWIMHEFKVLKTEMCMYEADKVVEGNWTAPPTLLAVWDAKEFSGRENSVNTAVDSIDNLGHMHGLYHYSTIVQNLQGQQS